MSRGSPQMQMTLPPTPSWLQKLLVGLFALYVVELVLNLVGFNLGTTLAWWPLSAAPPAPAYDTVVEPTVLTAPQFAPWQPITHFLVQGATPNAVTRVLLGLVVLYFLVPAVNQPRAVLAKAAAAAAAGALIVAFAIDLTGMLDPLPAFGWMTLTLVLPVLIGLDQPDKQILLGFVLPIPSKWFLWGTLVLVLLMLLVERSLGTFSGLGAWLGVVGWWHLLGPGARRRVLRQKAANIEAELRGFRVIDGGKSTGSNRPDDPIH